VTCGAPSFIFLLLASLSRLAIYLIINVFLLKNLSVYAIYYSTQKNPKQSEAKIIKYVRIFCIAYFLLIILLEISETLIEFESPQWWQETSSKSHSARAAFIVLNSIEFFLTCCLVSVLFVSAALI